MAIIVRKHDTKKTKFNQLQGSGLLPVASPICTKPKCIPTRRGTPKGPVPQTRRRNIPKPLIATKQSPKDNKWELNGQKYPDFNTLWVNIPRASFTVLRVNGQAQ